MALPWLLAYSTELRSVYSTLRRAVNEGIGADVVHSFLRNSGYEIPRSEVREVMGRLTYERAVGKYIDTLTDTSKPLKAYLPTSGGTMTKNYRYTLSVTGFNTRTGETATRTLSLTSQRLISKQAAVDLMVDAISERDGEPYIMVDSAKVTWIEKRA